MDDEWMRKRVSSARVGRFATVAGNGHPHVVPICFALVHDVVYSCVDDKPKRSQHLRRIANVQETGRACLLVDWYADDWSQLWWIRLDGHGRVVEDSGEQAVALTSLAEKYPQYTQDRPGGPVLAMDVTRISGWSAAEA